MISSRGKPLTSEAKKLTVSMKQYFDQVKITPAEPSVKCTADKDIPHSLLVLHEYLYEIKELLYPGSENGENE